LAASRAAPDRAALLNLRRNPHRCQIPARWQRASFSASRRSVFTRSPAFTGTNVGAITSHLTPNSASCSTVHNLSDPLRSRPSTAQPAQLLTSLRIESARFAIVPRLRTSSPGSATATLSSRHGHQDPKIVPFLHDRSSPLVALSCDSFLNHSLTTVSALDRSLHDD